MFTTLTNTEGTYFSDKFDMHVVSNLSLVLFNSSYIIFIKDSNQQVIGVKWAHKKNEKSLLKALQEESFFKLNVAVSLYYHTEIFALIPGVMYEASMNEAYLYFSGPVQEKAHTFNTSLESANLQLVSSIPSGFLAQLPFKSDELTCLHGSSSFLSFALKEKFNLVQQEILIAIYPGFIYLGAFKNQELVLFNRFAIADEENLLNYVFGIVHQLSFSPNFLRISILESNFCKLSQTWGSEYFKNIRRIKPISNQHYHKGAEQFKETGILEAFWLAN